MHRPDPVPAPASPRRRHARLLPPLLGALALGAVLLPAPARAWFVGGIGFGVPVFVGPPPVVYAPPPVVYAPPPAYPVPPPGYAPQAAYAPAPAYAAQGTEAVAGTTCAAGAYVCPLPAIAVVGTRCSCPTEAGGRAFGTIR